MQTVAETAGYVTLRNQVVQVLAEGKKRAQRAVEEETLRTYHKVGELINYYLLGNSGRADYGAQAVARLAEEVGLSKTVLYQTLAFFRLVPIFRSSGKLTWTHYRYLLNAPSLEAQEYYLSAVEKHGWSVRALRAQMEAKAFEQVSIHGEENGNGGQKREQRQPLQPLRGQLYTYRLVDIHGLSGLRIDVGFGVFLDREFAGLHRARAGQKVVSARQGPGYSFALTAGRKAAFYTYRARVLSVVDGDTLWLDIDCGFGVWTKQKVRLRGIDAPELATAAGRRAKDFVVQALSEAAFVGVTTTKPDKYDRYLADVFYGAADDAGDTVVQNGTFLNWELVTLGLAQRFREA